MPINFYITLVISPISYILLLNIAFMGRHGTSSQSGRQSNVRNDVILFRKIAGVNAEYI